MSDSRISAAMRAAVGTVAPEDFNPFAWACAETWLPIPAACANPGDPDHTETRVGIPGPGLRSQLNGGSQTEYGVRMRPGDIIRSTRRLGPYSEREGRLGRILLSTTEDTWTNQYDELVKRIMTTLIRY
ncbi:MaoC family dehydratase N-terminal domain-containing protein [Streptomyces sp. NPDC020792]|uniref:FAS1-like dehydratase domain-containing protein n=1 Tax=Streptomyces sp. NPDC020792 TaxID=3365089 RepID=UPI0037B3E68A